VRKKEGAWPFNAVKLYFLLLLKIKNIYFKECSCIKKCILSNFIVKYFCYGIENRCILAYRNKKISISTKYFGL